MLTTVLDFFFNLKLTTSRKDKDKEVNKTLNHARIATRLDGAKAARKFDTDNNKK